MKRFQLRREISVTLYRAAAAETLAADCTAFAAELEAARAYLDNPGYGGAALYRAHIETDTAAILDLSAERDPVATLVERCGCAHPGAIGADEWIPSDVALQDALRAEGIDWVIVRESYPAESVTWLWIGPFEREPDLQPIELSA